MKMTVLAESSWSLCSHSQLFMLRGCQQTWLRELSHSSPRFNLYFLSNYLLEYMGSTFKDIVFIDNPWPTVVLNNNARILLRLVLHFYYFIWFNMLVNRLHYNYRVFWVLRILLLFSCVTMSWKNLRELLHHYWSPQVCFHQSVHTQKYYWTSTFQCYALY